MVGVELPGSVRMFWGELKGFGDLGRALGFASVGECPLMVAGSEGPVCGEEHVTVLPRV